MSTNIEIIHEVVEYIDGHLEERLGLDSLYRISEQLKVKKSN